MVTNPKDEAEIDRMLQFFCDMHLVETWSMDTEGRIDILGDISIIPNRLVKSHLPLNFGTITGSFAAKECGLTTLVGAPHTVGGSFNIIKNQLQDLKGGPDFVGAEYYAVNNPLKSLEGIPTHLKDSIFINYTDTLPLLRLVLIRHVRWYILHKPPYQAKEVIDKYVGQGKNTVLNFALELKQAGFEENARW